MPQRDNFQGGYLVSSLLLLFFGYYIGGKGMKFFQKKK
ncbi:hypothetical protein BN938_2814 [Mucinivorans hirudinis]|uniref:Uncharacterized protein n=1 Tax=Mucinivorans hirudinis TaxID=1433126 RepID=A0A060RB87_9BACT|nr:hypothetical protein BN938_2814 [Mucinivorans hirudinis]